MDLKIWSKTFRQAASQVLDSDVRKDLQNLEVVFCKTATNTLLVRAFSLKKFLLWCSYKFPQDCLSKPLLYLHLQELTEQSAATSTADSLLGALGCTSKTLGLSVNLAE